MKYFEFSRNILFQISNKRKKKYMYDYKIIFSSFGFYIFFDLWCISVNYDYSLIKNKLLLLFNHQIVIIHLNFIIY